MPSGGRGHRRRSQVEYFQNIFVASAFIAHFNTHTMHTYLPIKSRINNIIVKVSCVHIGVLVIFAQFTFQV
jgi:hypothetical protein